ncbi:MAG: hypothetical protein DHS20C17_05960 [Cyclobacteriaceae bacterium]|nr:MAG: hypothetical protein DHS20C17_05960 [Cyclobacteriaceae bacterium]
MMNTGRVWLCALFLAGFWACSDDSENINEEVTTEDVANVTSIDEATITFSDAVTISNQILDDEGVMNGRTQECYTVSETQNENQRLVTFESTCEGFDGKFRSGSFLIEWEGSFQTEDFSYTLTFDGYEVNDYGLAGSITVSNLTYKENGFGFNVEVNDGVVNCPDGKQINYEQDFDYDFTLGEITELRITGSSSGMGKEGISYVANIKEAILIVSGCDYAVSGSFDATFNGRPVVQVSYGDGSCDNKANASRGDHSITFELD